MERGELSLERGANVDDEVWLSSPEQHDATDAVLRTPATQLLREEQVIAGGDDAVETDPPRDAVIRVRLVRAPRVRADHQVRLLVADHAANLAAQPHRHFELAVVVPQEHALLDAEYLRGGALLAFPRARDLPRRRLQIVAALVAAGQRAVDDARAGACPLRHRAATAEVGVVRVREHHERALRDLEGHVSDGSGCVPDAGSLPAPTAPGPRHSSAAGPLPRLFTPAAQRSPRATPSGPAGAVRAAPYFEIPA